MPKAARPSPKKRTRRTAEDAREQILDAAEKRLGAGGVGGIRLQEIAADVGVSHPTILHHFGSREGLVQAVVQRAMEALQRDTVRALTAEHFENAHAGELLRRVTQTLREGGHARLLTWLALEGRGEPDDGHMLATLAGVLHQRRLAETGRPASPEDTLFLVVMASLVLVGESVLGPATWHSAGKAADATVSERFRAWLIDLIEVHLNDGPRKIDRKARRASPGASAGEERKRARKA